MIALKCLQKPPELRYPTRRRPGRRPRRLPRRRAGLGPLDEPARPGRAGCWARPTTPPCWRTGACSGSATASRCWSSSALTNWLHLARRDGPLALRAALHRRAGRLGGVLLGAAPTRRADHVRRAAARPRLGPGIVAINLVFLVEWLLGLPVLSLAPMLAVTNGMLFLIKAGILSGLLLPPGRPPSSWRSSRWPAFPRFAPVIFGVVAAACFFVTGLKYRLRRLRSI